MIGTFVDFKGISMGNFIVILGNSPGKFFASRKKIIHLNYRLLLRNRDPPDDSTLDDGLDFVDSTMSHTRTALWMLMSHYCLLKLTIRMLY